MPADATMRIMVTGGAGFIGAAVVRQLIAETPVTVINVDKLTYAGNPESLGTARDHARHCFVQADIGDTAAMTRVFREHRPDAVMHLAAESHVDRSILRPDTFIDTNVAGTGRLLKVACDYWNELAAPDRTTFRFHHVSTDEVYGDLGPADPAFAETTPYAPSSPYSASKAASDHLVRAWHRTYGLPVLLSNCSNNYGPYQFPEKLIPLVILNAMQGETLPVYGRGENVRDWLYVEDHAQALRRVLADGEVGRTYNIGGRAERRNIDVVTSVCRLLDEMRPDPAGAHERLIRFVTDRPGHDRRYAIDSRRIEAELGWRPAQDFEAGLARTVRWYLDNPDWVARVRSGAYREWIQHNYAARGASS